MDYNFIKTRDLSTYEKLKSEGFQEINSTEPGVYVFLNCKKINFSDDIDQSKIKYTNTLCI